MLWLVIEVLGLAAWIVTHVAMLTRLFGVTEITTKERLIAVFVPIATPYLAWKYGHKKHTVFHVLLGLGYLAVFFAVLSGAAR